MQAIQHKLTTFWVIAVRPYAEKMLDNHFLDPEQAQAECARLNAQYNAGAEPSEAAEPYKVYEINGLMAPLKALEPVDFALECLRGYPEGSPLTVKDLLAPEHQEIRMHLLKLEEFSLVERKDDTMAELFTFLVELKNPLYKLERLEREANEARAAALALVERPYPAGSIIQYADMKAELIEDYGNSVLVMCDGECVKWYWKYDGATCALVALPKGR